MKTLATAIALVLVVLFWVTICLAAFKGVVWAWS